MARAFGITSPKTRTSAVMMKVASATPLSPNIRVRSAVASAADRMLTMLLPNKSAPIIRSRSSITFIALAAPVVPLSACAFSFDREDAVSAVSDPEKKADMHNSARMAAVVSQNVVSSGAFGIGSIAGTTVLISLVAAGSAFAGQRMVGQHKGLEVVVKDMGVDFGRGDVGMAKQDLDHPKIGATGQKMRGKGVAQDMRGDQRR